MSARPAVAVSADDAEFLAAALRMLTKLLDDRYQRPIRRVLDLEAELAAAAKGSAPGTAERPAEWPPASWRMTEDALDVAEVAEQLGCSRENVRALCRRGSLPAQRIGGRWLVDAQAVLDHLDRKGGTQCRTSTSTSTTTAATSPPRPAAR